MAVWSCDSSDNLLDRERISLMSGTAFKIQKVGIYNSLYVKLVKFPWVIKHFKFESMRILQ